MYQKLDIAIFEIGFAQMQVTAYDVPFAVFNKWSIYQIHKFPIVYFSSYKGLLFSFLFFFNSSGSFVLLVGIIKKNHDQRWIKIWKIKVCYHMYSIVPKASLMKQRLGSAVCKRHTICSGVCKSLPLTRFKWILFQPIMCQLNRRSTCVILKSHMTH